MRCAFTCCAGLDDTITTTLDEAATCSSSSSNNAAGEADAARLAAAEQAKEKESAEKAAQRAGLPLSSVTSPTGYVNACHPVRPGAGQARFFQGMGCCAAMHSQLLCDSQHRACYGPCLQLVAACALLLPFCRIWWLLRLPLHTHTHAAQGHAARCLHSFQFVASVKFM